MGLRRVGMIFQSFNLIPTMSARENVRLRWRSPGWASAASGACVRWNCSTVSGC